MLKAQVSWAHRHSTELEQSNGTTLTMAGMGMGGCEADVEINDCPNRVLLTRGEMHREIGDKVTRLAVTADPL